MAKIRVFQTNPTTTTIPAGPAGAYFGRYEFKPVADDPNVIEADIKDAAAIDFFLSPDSNFYEHTPKKKTKAELIAEAKAAADAVEAQAAADAEAEAQAAAAKG